MLMTLKDPASAPAERPAEKLFDALRALGEGWHSRGELAKRLGKARLTAYDAALLDVLIGDDRIEAAQEAAPGPIGYAWKYRIKTK